MHRHEQDPIKAAIIQAKNTGSLVLDDYVLITLPATVYNAEMLAEDSSSWYTSTNIRKLSCRNCGLKSLSNDLSLLENLEIIDLTGNKLTSFPQDAELPVLKILNISKNLLADLCSSCFATVTELHATENRIETLCFDVISPSGALIKLSLAKNRIRSIIAPSIYQYNLLHLDLADNALDEFDCAPFPSLETLILHHNRIRNIRNLSSLTKLRVLDLSYNRIQNDPHGFELFSISGDKEILHDLQAKRVFTNLREINLSNNTLQSIPSFIFSCPELSSADLSNNNIQRGEGMIIWEFRESSQLESLDLTANDMQELPIELGILKRLNKLRFDGNPMRRMRQIAGDSSCAKVLEYLRSKIPHDHPYYQCDKTSLSKQQRDKVAGQLKAMAENQIETEYTVLPNSSVVVRNAAASLSGCKLEFIDIHDIDDIPLSVLQTPNPSLKSLSSIVFRNCTCLTQNILQAILNNLNFDVAPSLRSLEVSGVRKPPIRDLVIYRSSVTHLTIKQLPSLVRVELADNPFLTDVVIEESGLEDLLLSSVASLKSLSLKSNRLMAIPESIFTPVLNIEELYLNGNSISAIPIDLINMKALQTLDLSCNLFKKLPNEMGLLSPSEEHEQSWTRQYAGSLTKIGLTGVYITHPPPSIVKRGALVMMRYMRECLDKEEFEQVLSVRRKLDHAFYENVRPARSGSHTHRPRLDGNYTDSRHLLSSNDAPTATYQGEVYNPYHATDEMLAEYERSRSRGSSRGAERDKGRILQSGGQASGTIYEPDPPSPPRRGRITQSSIRFGDEAPTNKPLDYGRVRSQQQLQPPSQPTPAQPPREDYERPTLPSRGHVSTQKGDPPRRHYLDSQRLW